MAGSGELGTGGGEGGGGEEEDDDVCAVCADGESVVGDPIVFCDGCDLAVHLGCYGIKRVPAGDWFCDACAAHRGKDGSVDEAKRGAVGCQFCPTKEGAFKRTHEDKWGGWAHVVCTLHYAETGMADQVRSAPQNASHTLPPRVIVPPWVRSAPALPPPRSPQGTQCSPTRRREQANFDRAAGFDKIGELASPKLRCTLCQDTASKTLGAKVQCAHHKCAAAFHPTCALARGFLSLGPDEEDRHGKSTATHFTILCEKHSAEERAFRAGKATPVAAPARKKQKSSRP